MSALFDFQSFLTVLLLCICTATYVKMKMPTLLDSRQGCVRAPAGPRGGGGATSSEEGGALTRAPLGALTRSAGPARRFRGMFWKMARIGERLSPWVSLGCFCMGFAVVFRGK